MRRECKYERNKLFLFLEKFQRNGSVPPLAESANWIASGSLEGLSENDARKRHPLTSPRTQGARSNGEIRRGRVESFVESIYRGSRRLEDFFRWFFVAANYNFVV